MLVFFHTKLALRSLVSQRKFSLISILSLALAFVSVLVISLWINNELSYDRHFPKHERIYRLTLEYQTPEGYESHFARVAQTWVQQVGQFIPEIENTVRFAPKRNTVITIGERQISTTRAFITDTTVFEVFDLEMLEGDPTTCLSNPNCVIIARSQAEKYFKDQSPVGEYISLFGEKDNEQREYLVTGIFKDFPSTTHIHPEYLLSFDAPDQYGWAYFYLLLHKNTNPGELQVKLDDYRMQRVDPEQADYFSLHMQPLAEIHLFSSKDREVELNGNIQSIYIMAGIAVLILILALFNYVNLNIAQLFREIRFLVINKIYGASVRSVFQFQLLKSIMVVLISLGLSIILFLILRSGLESYYSIHLELTGSLMAFSILVLLLLCLAAVIAGSVPAFQFIVRRFHQGMVTRATGLVRLFRPHKKFILRKILIGIQFFISLVLIIVTIFALLQIDFITSKRMGIKEGETLLVIKDLPWSVRPGYAQFRDILAKKPGILDITAMMETPPSPIKDAFMFEADCPVDHEDMILYIGPVADNFFTFFNRPIVAGSDFPGYIHGQEFESYILNETAVRLLGWSEPSEAIGKSFKVTFMSEGFFFGGKIQGVVEDFHQTTLHHRIMPTVFFQQPAFYLSFMIRFKTVDKTSAIQTIEDAWHEAFPDHPFMYTFQRQLYNAAYAGETAQIRLSAIFTLLAVIITLIGITGVTAILTEQRIREAAIRKVLGAGTGNILVKLSQEVLIILLISIVLAIPASLLLTGRWLENFAYAIIPGNWWWVPVVISVLALLLVTMVVSAIVLRTARRNPVKGLGRE